MSLVGLYFAVALLVVGAYFHLALGLWVVSGVMWTLGACWSAYAYYRCEVEELEDE